ncbi:MAG: hypothetical protein AB8B83_01345 [Bdellovibrionales bacterium]
MSVFRGIRLKTFVIFALAAIAGAALLHTSQRVQGAEERLARINADISREEDTIRVLRAEWEYLNRPQRLERLAKEFLDLVPPSPKKMPETMMDNSDALPVQDIKQHDFDGEKPQPANYQSGGGQ